MVFKDRFDGGRLLACKLSHYREQPNIIVLALPRGGAPVASEVAKALDAPLDVFLVRKLGLPGHPELAMGAVATGGVRVLNEDLVYRLRIADSVIEKVAQRELEVLRRQEQRFRDRRPPPLIEGRTVILVDDGLATGSTMRAAAAAVRQQHPRRLVVAVPIGAAQTCDEFGREVDEVVAVACPEDFQAVALWYEDFSQTPDELVVALLKGAAVRRRTIVAGKGADRAKAMPLSAMNYGAHDNPVDHSRSV